MRVKFALTLILLSLTQFSAASDRLQQNESLSNGQFIISEPYGKYKLVMQVDGSLVLYRADGSIRYSMDKLGSYAVMQADGNFVEYNSVGGPLWNTGTGGRCPCPNPPYVRVYDDGNLTVNYGFPPQAQTGLLWQLGPDPTPNGTANGVSEPVYPGPRPANIPQTYPPLYYN